MLLAALLAGLVLWLTLGTKAMLLRRNRLPLAAMVAGVASLAAGHPLIGLVLAGGAFAWIRWPRRKRAPAARSFSQDMAIADARDLLGLPADADRDAIITAHRRLIARNHPDSGGTEALAARLNAARDLLLREERD